MCCIDVGFALLERCYAISAAFVSFIGPAERSLGSAIIVNCLMFVVSKKDGEVEWYADLVDYLAQHRTGDLKLKPAMTAAVLELPCARELFSGKQFVMNDNYYVHASTSSLELIESAHIFVFTEQGRQRGVQPHTFSKNNNVWLYTPPASLEQ